MAQSRHGFLLPEDFPANGAAHLSFQPCFRAGWGDVGSGGLLMPQGRNDLLRNKDLLADAAMLPLGFPILGAGGFHRYIRHRSMTQGGNFLTAGENLSANLAAGAFGYAALGAGGFHRLHHLRGMAQSGNFLTAGENFFTDRAADTLGHTILGAGGFHLGNRFLLMSCSGNDLLLLMAAEAAFQRKQAILGAGGLRYHGFHIVVAGFQQIGQGRLGHGQSMSILDIFQELP